MDGPLRVGVIGLGRPWKATYLPALAARREGFAVAAVCDAVASRTARVARRMGCAAAAGPAELLERPDVEALLLLETDWHGLWPLERAAALGKPALCVPPLEADGPHADALVAAVRERGAVVVFGLLPRLAPVFARMRALVETQLGSARVVLCDSVTLPGEDGDEAGLLDLCGLLLGTPRSVQAGPQTSAHAALLLDFGDGRSAQVTRRRAPHRSPRTRVEVIAERGWVMAELPSRLAWGDAEGVHRLRLADRTPPAGVLLDQFHAAVRPGTDARRPPAPGIEDAARVLAWVQSARRVTDA
jgi:predicted dehydrogenase